MKDFFLELKNVVINFDNQAHKFVAIIIQTYNNSNGIQEFIDCIEDILNDEDCDYELFTKNLEVLIEMIIVKKYVDPQYEMYFNHIFSIVSSLIYTNSNDELVFLMEEEYNIQKEVLNKYSKMLDELSIKLNSTIEKQENKIRDLIPQTISTVGIFIAVITVIFGGFNLISAFQTLGSQTSFRMISVSLFVGLIILNVLFLLMFLLSKLSDKPIYSACRHFDGLDSNKEYTKSTDRTCINCKLDQKGEYERCSQIKRTFAKYPYIIIINYIGFFIGVILIFIWIIMRAFSNNMVDNPVKFITLMGMFGLILFSCITYLVVTMDRKKKINIKIHKHIIKIKRKRIILKYNLNRHFVKENYSKNIKEYLKDLKNCRKKDKKLDNKYINYDLRRSIIVCISIFFTLVILYNMSLIIK